MKCIMFSMFFFFFSSRRRHTRWPRDWSSDVCSSDLRRRVPPRLRVQGGERAERDDVLRREGEEPLVRAGGAVGVLEPVLAQARQPEEQPDGLGALLRR